MSYSTAVSDVSSVECDGESGYEASSQSRQSKGHGTDTSYYTPKKGNLYHLDAKCPVLRLKKVGGVHRSVPRGFEPCVLCDAQQNACSTYSDTSPIPKDVEPPKTQAKGEDQKEPSLFAKALTLSFGAKKQDSHADAEESASPTRVTSTASSRSVSTREVEYVTTRTGRFYHQDPQCYNLRSATRKIFVTRVRADLEACYLCVSEEAVTEASPREAAADDTRADSTTERGVTGPKLSKPLITTRTGRFYHSDSNCENLRSARKKIAVYAVPTDLEPCYKCVTSSGESEAASRGDSTRGRYITTRTGRFYHLDYDCYNLRSAKAKFRKQTVPAGLQPCYKCA